jgi:nucleotide-binding universal stress UspA family protein
LIRKILVAIDGTESSERALDFALDLAEKYNASLLLLNVFQLPPSTRLPDEPMVAYSGRITVLSKDFQRNHEKILAKALAHARNIKPNRAVSIKLKEGEPALEIVD